MSKRSTHCGRSRIGAFALLGCAWMALSTPGQSLAQSNTEQEAANPLTQADIDAAIAKVKADPNLLQERSARVLRWRSDTKDEKEKEKRERDSGWFDWLGDFFTFIAETGRVIVWLALAAAAALLGVLVYRLVREIGPRDRPLAFTAPTHVRDLDIRPESLPDDIGGAALALWNRGEHRAALALLYRGLLSRLVHVYELPIRHSSTEGDCLALTQQRLERARADYAGKLIRVWQRAVYGAQEPQTAEVESLCRDFDAALEKAPEATLRERVA